MAERTFRVSGRVQGVGFRWWTRSLAERLGLDGTVRNEPDGTVVVRARGSHEAMAELEEELRRGPPGASVHSLDAVDSPVPATQGFRIEH